MFNLREPLVNWLKIIGLFIPNGKYNQNSASGCTHKTFGPENRNVQGILYLDCI